MNSQYYFFKKLGHLGPIVSRPKVMFVRSDQGKQA